MRFFDNIKTKHAHLKDKKETKLFVNLFLFYLIFEAMSFPSLLLTHLKKYVKYDVTHKKPPYLFLLKVMLYTSPSSSVQLSLAASSVLSLSSFLSVHLQTIKTLLQKECTKNLR